MVSFVCDTCQETVKKPKLEAHVWRCRRAKFSCLDCNTSFSGVSYKDHTSCITEKQKFETCTNKNTDLRPQAPGKDVSTHGKDVKTHGKDIKTHGKDVKTLGGVSHKDHTDLRPQAPGKDVKTLGGVSRKDHTDLRPQAPGKEVKTLSGVSHKDHTDLRPQARGKEVYREIARALRSAKNGLTLKQLKDRILERSPGLGSDQIDTYLRTRLVLHPRRVR